MEMFVARDGFGRALYLFVRVVDGAGDFRGMTWKRVATAVVLIPFVVGLVLYASTAVVAVALAAVIVLAMIEYFALGDAIGHRAYRVWTLICAVLLVYAQWLSSVHTTRS